MLTIADSEIAISTIVQAEMFAGSAKSQAPERSREIQRQFFRRFTIVSFGEKSALIYGDIRASLEQRGTPIGGNDVLIAASALAHDLILVSHNVGEFARVPGLKLEDWEAI